MSVLDRARSRKSPLADLHLLANELGVDGFRRLRKADLIDAILARQSGATRRPPTTDDAARAEAPRRRARGAGRRGRGAPPRTRRGRGDDEAPRRPRRAAAARRPRRAPAATEAGPDRERAASRAPREAPGAEDEGDRRGRRRAARQRLGLRPPRPPEPSDDDVYISAAQVKRCELVSATA